MKYQAQPVIRTRTPDGVELIEQVKARAEDEGKTFSEMALDLIAAGLSGPPATAAAEVAPESTAPTSSGSAAPGPTRSPETPARRATTPPDPTASPESEPKAAPAPSPAASESTAPAVEIEEVSTLDADVEPAEIAQKCMERLNVGDMEGVGQMLADFYAVAGAYEGGQVRKELKSRLLREEYEALVNELQQTEEYQAYRRRVIFER